MMVRPDLGTPDAREKALCLIRAGSIMGVVFRMINRRFPQCENPPHFRHNAIAIN
jgi:hypothetical protein